MYFSPIVKITYPLECSVDEFNANLEQFSVVPNKQYNKKKRTQYVRYKKIGYSYIIGFKQQTIEQVGCKLYLYRKGNQHYVEAITFPIGAGIFWSLFAMFLFIVGLAQLINTGYFVVLVILMFMYLIWSSSYSKDMDKLDVFIQNLSH